jgi:hypothetical protein
VTLMRPCMDCGELTDLGPRCDACRPVASRARERARTSRDRGTFWERGYDFRWTYLSRRARRLQPRCSDCGSSEDLTGHHTAEAWRRRDAGLPIRLSDIDALCRDCSARTGDPRATEQQGPARATRPRAGGWWRRWGRGRPVSPPLSPTAMPSLPAPARSRHHRRRAPNVCLPTEENR